MVAYMLVLDSLQWGVLGTLSSHSKTVPVLFGADLEFFFLWIDHCVFGNVVCTCMCLKYDVYICTFEEVIYQLTRGVQLAVAQT